MDEARVAEINLSSIECENEFSGRATLCTRVYVSTDKISGFLCVSLFLSFSSSYDDSCGALRNADLSSRLRPKEKPAALVIRDTTGYPAQYYRRIWGALLSLSVNAHQI